MCLASLFFGRLYILVFYKCLSFSWLWNRSVFVMILVEFGWCPWCYESPRSASTPADRSKRSTQLSPGAALPALCLLVSGRFGFAVHGMGYWVYGDKDYDENGQEKGTYFGAVWCMGYGGRYVLRC